MVPKKKKEGDEVPSLLSGMRKIIPSHTLSEIHSSSTKSSILEPRWYLRSGIKCLDLALDAEGRGIGSGKMLELFGPNKSGKSEAAQHIANAFLYQYKAASGSIIYADKERALQESLLRAREFIKEAYENKTERLMFLRPETIEDLFEDFYKIFKYILDRIKTYKLKNPEPILWVVDSLAAFDTNKKVKATETADKKSGEKTQFSELPAILANNLNRVRSILDYLDNIIIWINEARADFDNPGGFKSPGGNPYHHRLDYRILLMRGRKYWMQSGVTNTDGAPSNGHTVRVEVIKNKSFMPDRRLQMVLTYLPFGPFTSGLSDAWTTWEALKEISLIKSVGSGKYSMRGFEEKFTRLEWVDVFLRMHPNSDPNAELDKESPLWKCLKTWQETTIIGKFGDGYSGIDEDDANSGAEVLLDRAMKSLQEESVDDEVDDEVDGMGGMNEIMSELANIKG